MRIAIVSTHPIQYHTPWFRELSRQNIELKVYYALIPDAQQQGVGFCRISNNRRLALARHSPGIFRCSRAMTGNCSPTKENHQPSQASLEAAHRLFIQGSLTQSRTSLSSLDGSRYHCCKRCGRHSGSESPA